MIRFDLPVAGYTWMVIYDLMGRSVQTLVDGHLSAGSHQVSFGAGRLSSGTYIYRLETAGFTATRKMMLVNNYSGNRYGHELFFLGIVHIAKYPICYRKFSAIFQADMSFLQPFCCIEEKSV